MGGGKRKTRSAQKAAASGGVAAARAPAAAEPTVYKRGTPVLVKAKPQDGWKTGVVIGTTNRGKPLVTLEGAELGIVWTFIKVREATPESSPPASAAGGSPPGGTERSTSGGTGETEPTDRTVTDPTGPPPAPPTAKSLAQGLAAAPAPDGGAAAVEPRQGLAPAEGEEAAPPQQPEAVKEKAPQHAELECAERGEPGGQPAAAPAREPPADGAPGDDSPTRGDGPPGTGKAVLEHGDGEEPAGGGAGLALTAPAQAPAAAPDPPPAVAAAASVPPTPPPAGSVSAGAGAASKIGQTERLLGLRDHLHRRVVGQDAAVQAVADAVLRHRAGLGREGQPVGSFLFLGPTGVGKTELAKAVAEELCDDHRLTRIDMGEYTEQHAASRLIGAPGCGGHGEGELAEAVRRRPYTVVLFHDMEKAHPEVLNVLLQVLGDGRLTDSQGRVVDFSNTVIIMTSNLGAEHLLQAESTAAAAEVQVQVMQAVRRHFRPNLLNGVDEIVFFHRLGRGDLGKVIDLQLESIRKRLGNCDVQLKLTKDAQDAIVQRSYNPVYGARSMQRFMEREITTLLSRELIAGRMPYHSDGLVGVDRAGNFTFLATINEHRRQEAERQPREGDCSRRGSRGDADSHTPGTPGSSLPDAPRRPEPPSEAEAAGRRAAAAGRAAAQSAWNAAVETTMSQAEAERRRDINDERFEDHRLIVSIKQQEEVALRAQQQRTQPAAGGAGQPAAGQPAAGSLGPHAVADGADRMA